jgi:hypothetical protein
LYAYRIGTQFLSRPEFADPECRDWAVIKAWSFAGIDEHVALRTERFDFAVAQLAAISRKCLRRQCLWPSQEEHALSCAIDCTEQCGNAICDAGENVDHCPSDCEIPILTK